MKSWNKIFKRGDPESVDGNSSLQKNSLNNAPLELTPQRALDDDLSDDANSTAHSSSTPPYVQGVGSGGDEGTLKDRLRTLLPQSWGSILQKWSNGDADSDLGSAGVKIVPNGTRVSPPVSPILERRYWDTQDSLGTSNKSSHRPLLRDVPIDNDLLHYLPEESELTSIHPAEYYAEKVEVYKLKYSYMKSWPGLLRLLAGFELLFGGMVLACVCAYIHKDSEWSNSYGLYNGAYNNGYGTSGKSYNGPMTLFVIAVVGVAWIVTILLLVIGLTMYYRTILLDSPWWPLTEGVINVALFLLYMAAGIVYLNDLNRGGLCYMTIGINPIMSSLCRVDGGQMAGTAFIFINMLMYLISFLVCLKMWRHEATRREIEFFKNQENLRPIPVAQSKSPNPQTKRIVFEDEMDSSMRATKLLHVTDFQQEEPGSRNRAIPTGYAQKPRVIADYVMKYPEISSLEDREKYKAVFNDQYQEYKDLHKDISETLVKFRELDAMMGKLLKDGNSHEEQKRIQRILKKYEQKKSDPAFLEKKERCDYLKAKLSHIKNRIRNFDQDTMAKGRT
ncbi:MARVEL domain-containing protein 2 [Oncorhynchus masou masou]|uniref:MARVEL domain-containing protein 2 n=1 Tax=Oncorhynchus masou masou TaxID=90313 RepID=UPI003183FACB